jgi:hypothetical protein
MRRLGKQRVETLQILQVLAGIRSGWKNHPAVKMWRGHEWSLGLYGRTICQEWIERGYKDTCMGKIALMMGYFDHDSTVSEPEWFGRDDFHASHRSNLLRKDYTFYSQFKWTEPTDLPYVWPVR